MAPAQRSSLAPLGQGGREVHRRRTARTRGDQPATKEGCLITTPSTTIDNTSRENGFCKEVFDFCRPELVIISDGAMQYASQDMIDRYAYRAAGVYFGPEHRRVLTTRCDGTICIFQSLAANTGAWVGTDRSLRRALPRPQPSLLSRSGLLKVI